MNYLTYSAETKTGASLKAVLRSPHYACFSKGNPVFTKWTCFLNYVLQLRIVPFRDVTKYHWIRGS